MAEAGNDRAQRVYDLAKEYEIKYGGCSQCTIAVLQDELNLRNDAIFKAATGLAGGCGRLIDGCCGAYTGPILVISSLRGRGREELAGLKHVRGQTHELVRRFHQKFTDEYGSVICRDIQTKSFGRSYNLSDPEENKKFKSEACCGGVVGKAARWAIEYIEAAGLTPPEN